jgi:hypothetical protein
MNSIKLLALATLGMAGTAVGGMVAMETTLPLPTAPPLEASISRADSVQSDGGMRTFALACGLLAFAAAAQQACFPGKLSGVRASSKN